MKKKLFCLAATTAVAWSVPALAQDAQSLLRDKGCLACHSVDNKVVGPAYKDVAKKYRGRKDAEAYLAGKIREGSNGVWGQNGGYELPYGITAAVDFSAYSGVPSQQTYLFLSNTTNPFPSSTGGVTLRVGPYGAVAAPPRYMTNARASKTLKLRGTQRLRIDVDAFNLFNTNVPWSSGADPSISFLEGPTYGLISRVATPRVGRAGVTFAF